MFRGADVATQRDILDKLVDSITIERPSPGVYQPKIAWSPLGKRLESIGNNAVQKAWTGDSLEPLRA